MTKEFYVEQMMGFEAPITRMLSLFAEDRLDWSPCENTMPLRVLVQHVVDVVGGDAYLLTTTEFVPSPPDFQKARGKSVQDLDAAIRSAFTEAKEAYAGMSQESFEKERISFGFGEMKIEGTVEEIAISICYRHMSNNVMQLFWYLRESGVDADSGTLYFGLLPGEFSTRMPPEVLASAN